MPIVDIVAARFPCCRLILEFRDCRSAKRFWRLGGGIGRADRGTFFEGNKKGNRTLISSRASFDSAPNAPSP